MRLLGLVPVMVAVGVVALVRPRRARPARVPECASAAWGRGPGRVGPMGPLARVVSRAGRLGRRALRLPDDPAAERRTGIALVALVTVALAEPILGLALAGVAVVRSTWSRRRVRERDERALLDDLPEAVDLLAVALSAGFTVPLAVSLVGARGRGRVAGALAEADELHGRGVALAEALDRRLGALGDPTRGLLRILRSSIEDGTSAAEALERLAAEVRTDRRRAAEGRARTLPVRLLFPLVLCILPAFALLTVVPLLAGALDGLPW